MSKFWASGDDSSDSSSQSEFDNNNNNNDNDSDNGNDDNNNTFERIMTSNNQNDNKNELNFELQDLWTSVNPLDPNRAWKQLGDSQPFIKPKEVTPTENNNNNNSSRCLRIVCISDTHAKHEEFRKLPKGNVLIHAGDATKTGEVKTLQNFAEYLQYQQDYNFDHVIYTPGNHDMTLHEDYYLQNWKRFHRKPFDCQQAQQAVQNENMTWQYLVDSSYTINDDSSSDDIEIYGSPWSPEFSNWAFNADRGEQCLQIWKQIPSSTDILITHGPPLGRGDETFHNGYAGCVDLLQQVQCRIKPRVHIFGHIHEDAGVTFDGHTMYVNASSLNFRYQPSNYPVVIDLPLHDKSKPAMIVKPQSKCLGDLIEYINANNQDYPKLMSRKKGDLKKKDNNMPLYYSDKGEQDAVYSDVCNKLCLYHDRDAQAELRRAMFDFYASCF